MELPRTRDCIVQVKGDTLPVVVHETLVTSGWLGGQGMSWVPSSRDDLLVGVTDGNACGFMLWGSDETSDQYTAMTRNQPYYRSATMCFGGWQIQTGTYERYTYASRVSGPLVPLVYQSSARLRFSLRGYWTVEDEWSLSGDPRAPNSYYTGYVSQVPSQVSGYYLGVQVSI
jgi:hypothetical protein